MSLLPPTQWSEMGKIIYEERLKEAEQSRRLAALPPAKSRSWLLNLSRLFKPKSDKPGQPENLQPGDHHPEYSS